MIPTDFYGYTKTDTTEIVLVRVTRANYARHVTGTCRRGLPKAVLFDLDETLDDRALSLSRYAGRFHTDFRSRLSPIPPSDIAANILDAYGDGSSPRKLLVDRLLCSLAWNSAPPRLEQALDHWFTWFPQSLVRRDGIEALFNQLVEQRIAIGVVTNGEQKGQETKLKCLGLNSYLSVIAISEVLKVAKPYAAIFHHALDRLGCRPEEAWFIGDNPVNDVVGASEAGLQAIWLPSNLPWPSERPQPDWRITSLSELLALFS